MRIFIFMLAFLCVFQLNAQLLNPALQWFESNSFFNSQFIKKRGITDIHIIVKNKKDGEAIDEQDQFLHYTFGSNGQLKQFYKSISLYKNVDTATVDYFYNYDNQLIQRIEKQGEFNFKYIYRYGRNGLPTHEYKVDLNTILKDTLYSRALLAEKYNGNLLIKSLNNKGVPYKIKRLVYKNDKLRREQTTFVRNQNFERVEYHYQKNKLIGLKHIHYFNRKKQTEWRYSYEGPLINGAIFYNNEERIKKRTFIYHPNGLVKTVIERNYEEKSIKIYKFLYHFNEG